MTATHLRHRRRRCHRRKGYVLIIFALLFFGLMALAALVIDLGLARMTQRQMQTAVDAAALEGLWGRNRQGISDPDVARRQAASEMVGLVFDDDLNPTGGDNRNFGAGPRIDLVGGIPLSPDFAASQTIVLPVPPVYDPVVSLNTGNAVDGDLVVGDFNDAADLSHREEVDYTRDDFAPTTDSDDAFLARLRRTNESLDPAVGQSGGTIPYLFGRGSLLSLESRGRGIAVRATAIAQARRAKSVGRSDGANELPGALAIVLVRNAWEGTLTVDTPATLTVTGDGSVTIGGSPVGRVIEATGAGQIVSLGDLAGGAQLPVVPTPDVVTFVATAVAAAPIPPQAQVYVSVVADPNNPLIPWRVIGFGLADIAPLGGDQFQLIKRQNRIAIANASPVPVHPLDSSLFADAANDPELAELLSHHNALVAPLLTPALVR